MVSERVQRQIDRLLDEADETARALNWDVVRERSQAVLAFDPENKDGLSYIAAADRGQQRPSNGGVAQTAGASPAPTSTLTPTPVPTSFASGRYQVKKFLGEGGKKKVYLAHDTLLDHDVAFALIKTEGLDDVGATSIGCWSGSPVPAHPVRTARPHWNSGHTRRA